MNQLGWILELKRAVARLNKQGVKTSINPSGSLEVFSEPVAIYHSNGRYYPSWWVQWHDPRDIADSTLYALDGSLGAYLTMKTDLIKSGLATRHGVGTHDIVTSEFLVLGSIDDRQERVARMIHRRDGSIVASAKSLDEALYLVRSPGWAALKGRCKPGKTTAEMRELAEQFGKWVERRRRRGR